MSPLELLRRLGNPACALCGDCTHLLDLLEVSRVCNECAEGLEEEATVPCYNRFLFAGSVELHVSDEEGLREAIDDAEQEGSPCTIVMTADIELSATLELYCEAICLRCANKGITLRCESGPAVMSAAHFLLVEDVHMHSGCVRDSYYGDHEGRNFPTIEAIKSSRSPTHMLLRNTSIHGFVGSGVMNDGNAVVLEGCSVSTEYFFGFINKTHQGHFFAAAYGCRFSKSLWHISAGAELLEDDEKALIAANIDRAASANDGGRHEFVTRRNKEWRLGTVQPWSCGWLRRGKAAAV